MKKVLLVALAAGAALVARKRLGDSRAEQALWAEATDSVDRA